jgi:uncharacterized membrane protein
MSDKDTTERPDPIPSPQELAAYEAACPGAAARVLEMAREGQRARLRREERESWARALAIILVGAAPLALISALAAIFSGRSGPSARFSGTAVGAAKTITQIRNNWGALNLSKRP